MSGKPVRETSSTKYYGKITVYRYEDAWNPEQTETYSESFEATSIQSAKAKLTKIANAQELFSWVQSWDNENGHIQEKTYVGNPGVRPFLTSRKMEPLSVIAPATLRENSARPFIQPPTNTERALSIG